MTTIIQKMQTIRNKRVTTTITQHGTTQIQSPRANNSLGDVDVPEFIKSWQYKKGKENDERKKLKPMVFVSTKRM